jgi:hypothetical protein
MPTTYEDAIVSGDSRRIKFTLQDSEENPVDIRSVDLTYVVVGSVGSDTYLIEKTIGSGIEVVDGLNGRFDVVFEPSDTADLSGTYKHEIQMVDTDDPTNVTTVMRGTFTVIADIIE